MEYVHIIAEKSFLLCFCVSNVTLITFPSELYNSWKEIGGLLINRVVEFFQKYKMNRGRN